MADVVFGNQVSAGDQAAALWGHAAHQVVVQADGGVMALGKRVLTDGAVDHAFLDELHGLVDEVEGDHPNLAGFTGILDGCGCAEGATRGDVDASQIGMSGHEVLSLSVGGVALIQVLDFAHDLDVRVVLFQVVDEASAAQFVSFHGEEAGDDGHLAGAVDRFSHGLASRLALLVKVGTHEEQALVLSGRLGVEGGYRNARFHCLVDEGSHTTVTRDGGDGVVFLSYGRLDGLAEDLRSVLVARHDPVDRHAIRRQLFGCLLSAFLDWDPEGVVLQAQHRDLHWPSRLLVNGCNRTLIRWGAGTVKGWRRWQLHSSWGLGLHCWRFGRRRTFDRCWRRPRACR